MIFKLAFRNIFRNKRRSTLTILGIAMGVVTIILIGAYYEFSYYGLRESLIRSHYAHIQIYAKGYPENKESDPFKYLIENSNEIINTLKADKRIRVITPRIRTWGIISTPVNNSSHVEIKGIIPENETLINTFITKRKGREIRSGDIGNVELGASLAEEINVDIGEEVIITTITAEGFQNALQLEVQGILGSFSEELDKITVKIPIDLAREFLEIEGVQEIVILLDRTANTAVCKKIIEEKIKEYGWDLEVTSWYEQAGYYRQVVAFYGGYFYIIMIIACIVAFFTTLNTLLMVALERMTEIGTIRSFGYSRYDVFKLFLVESIVIGLAGFIIGSSLAGLTQLIINGAGGFTIPKPPGATADIPAALIITGSHILLSLIISIVVPVIAAIIPAVKTVKMQVIEQILCNETK